MIFRFLPVLMVCVVGCKEQRSTPPIPEPVAGQAAPEAKASSPVAPSASGQKLREIHWTEELLHSEIRHYNPGYRGTGKFAIENGTPGIVELAGEAVENLKFLEGVAVMGLDLSDTPVADLSSLKGLPLREVMLERTKVTDLSPLKGAKIEKLYLSGTPVGDVSALEGMPLSELNAVGTKIADIGPLAKCPLQMLWLTEAPVEDISALRTMPLVSVTLHKTRVKDLTPLSGTGLKRLHIGETNVTDLSPLAGMGLTRLVFTPGKIQAGLDAVKALPALAEIGSRFDDEAKDLVPPVTFWAGLQSK
jgi:internalin A